MFDNENVELHELNEDLLIFNSYRHWSIVSFHAHARCFMTKYHAFQSFRPHLTLNMLQGGQKYWKYQGLTANSVDGGEYGFRHTVEMMSNTINFYSNRLIRKPFLSLMNHKWPKMTSIWNFHKILTQCADSP